MINQYKEIRIACLFINSFWRSNSSIFNGKVQIELWKEKDQHLGLAILAHMSYDQLKELKKRQCHIKKTPTLKCGIAIVSLRMLFFYQH